ARKEYVESFTYFHQQSDTLYYGFPEQERPFPVPEPMWPRREDKQSGRRHFDVVIGTDFRLGDSDLKVIKRMIHIHKQHGLRIRNASIKSCNRELIDGTDVNILVYGERITCDVLLIKHPPVLQEKQYYLPTIETKTVSVIIDVLPVENGMKIYECRSCVRHLD